MNLDRAGRADAFTAAEFVASGFIGHPADVVFLVDIQYLLRAEHDASAATRAQCLINHDYLVHSVVFPFEHCLQFMAGAEPS